MSHSNIRVQRKLNIVRNLVPTTDTPFIILEESEAIHSWNIFHESLPFVTPHYAVKSNNHPGLIRALIRKKSSFDVASAGEIDLLTTLGVSGRRMICANPIKDERTIRSMLSNGVAAFTFDNEMDLVRIKRIAEQKNILPQDMPSAVIRLHTVSENVQTDLSIKFGATLDKALELSITALNLGFPLAGAAFHVGTQSRDVTNYRKAFMNCLTLFDQIRRKTGHECNLIDFGGGFPIDTVTNTGQLGQIDFFNELSQLIRDIIPSRIRLIAEPGRFISAPTGTLVSRIVGVSERQGRKFIYLDDGVYGCYSGIIFDHAHFSYYPFRSELAGSLTDELIPTTIAGPTCDSIDIIAHDVLLPADLTEGDYIITPDIGAYSTASATTFNGFETAKIIFKPDCRFYSILPQSTPAPSSEMVV